jgi:tetratricopeptide (TPR) repeat protein
MVELAPKRFETRAALAAFYRQNKQPDKAEKTLREAIEANKEDDQRYLALADLIVANQGVDAAVKEIQAFISARPKAYPIQFKLGQLYNATGRLEEANKAYLGVIAADKTGPSGLQARLQLAGNYVVARRNAEAEKLVEEVLKENPRDNRGLLFRAQLALAKKDNVGAINDLRAVLKDQPGSTQVVSLLANAHRLNKEVPLGREVISSAMKLYPKNADLRLLLADFLFATGDRPGALRELDDLIKQDPRNVRAYEAKAVVQTRGKDFVGAEQTFAALKAATPDSPIGAYRLGLTYSAQRKYDAAVREFESALAKAPNAREVVTALIAAHAAQGKLDQAVARTRQIAKEQPTNFLPHLILGDIYTAQKKYPDAEDAFAKARQLNPRATGVYLGLSRMYSFSGDRSKAAAVLEEGQKTIPNEPVLMLALAEVYQRAGEHDRAIEQYETLLKRNPANDVVANNLAFLLADRKGDKGNLDRALTLAKRFEDSANAAFIDTLGWIHFKRGEHELAVPLLQKAHDQFPTSPSYMYHLGAALLKSGKAAEGKALVQRAIESKEEFANREEARKILASG